MRLKRKKLKPILGACALTMLIFFLPQSSGTVRSAALAISRRAGLVGVALTIPEGIFKKDTASVAEKTAPAPAPKPTPTATQPQTTTAAPTTQKAAAVSAKNYDGMVQTTLIQNSGKNYGNVYVANKTGLSIDIKKELGATPDVKIYKNSSPQVLIFHTHATECYLPEDSGYYKKSWPSRTTDNTKNVVAVGNAIAQRLNAAGIVTLHDTTQHDKVSYNGSYERSTQTVEKYLEQYPSIDVVLDIHRDAVTREDGTKIKPTVEIGGRKAAQVMICTGSQTGAVTGFPDWRQNLRFALRVQQTTATMYPNLMRPVYFVSKKYNHQLSHGAILLEMGSEGNTLDEAVYSGELIGNALVSLLGDDLAAE